ncbi:hypothetical protein CYMTET_29268 [Cymbomonas tetramitiformis]|uniref:EGF-like domain-containing protein n=1 Tax=Cymbomonas tetramitiformis TaxID=36881 RepID=A0AAE0KVD2_9CHLO|nr:hypothetical protein CYMTET_29268 [Cymbomonas tetramitiformis]
MSASAAVPSSSVTIDSILDGSAYVRTTVTFYTEDVAAGADANAFITLLSSDPGSIFSTSSNLVLSASATSMGQTSIAASGDSITVAVPSTPSPPPPPPPSPPTPECAPGFAGVWGDGSWEVPCVDVDECAVSNGRCDNLTQCIDLPAGRGRECGECPLGFTGSGETACLDINECAENNGGCDFQTDCINSAPGFACTDCPVGFSGDGLSGCNDIDECTSEAAPCDERTECINVLGTFTCTPCPSPYLGTGREGCWLAEDCSSQPCDPNTACTMAAGAVVCSACPAGFAGTGATSCIDVDGCADNPCYLGVACTDIPAPGVGYTCGDCPMGYVGDGVLCNEDLCATGTACSTDPLVTCSMLPSGDLDCGPCPDGYSGTGVTCEDIDECQDGTDGGCHFLTECINLPGGHICSACPEGYIGSGETRCSAVTDCSENNGGCWDNGIEHVTCEATQSVDTSAVVTVGVLCGDCPVGYAGNGYDGCVDESGCFPGACDAMSSCRDVLAPGTGYTCDPCPAGYEGDAQGPNSTMATPPNGCYENRCFTGNGGCAYQCNNFPTHRECGPCPTGYTDIKQDGTLCMDSPGCFESPCFAGVACTDVPAPGTGRICGTCPTGYVGDGALCLDVDECQDDVGGCFRNASLGVVTTCTNVERSAQHPKGRVCGPCPDGYKGSGETGCVLVTTCAMDNGGCWVGSGDYAAFSTTCTDVPGVGTECGACPEGFEGTGATGCVDIDGCAEDPCAAGVRCSDVRAPGTGFKCTYDGALSSVDWACPEGYRGDGMTCTLCSMSVRIIDSTIVSGKETRFGWNTGRRAQVNGQLDGLDSVACTNQEGTQFMWESTVSDGSEMTLTAARHQANTLKLSIPKLDLMVGRNYVLKLTSYLTGNPTVRDTESLSFVMDSLPLVLVITGGDVVTGSANVLTLSTASSVDPDGEAGPIMYSWSCRRDDGRDACRYQDGALLPLAMRNETIQFTLLGDINGVNYTFSCEGTKGSRTSTTSTRLSIFSGAPPVVVMTPFTSKSNPTSRLSLSAEVTSADPATLQMQWSVACVTDPAQQLVLNATTLSTPLDSEALVVRAGVLTPGFTYSFTLSAWDRIGPASATLSVTMNTCPSLAHGTGISVLTTNGTTVGTELETVFTISASGWTDDDLPLQYQMLYRVVGGATSVYTPLINDFTTLASPYQVSVKMPEAGLAAHQYLVSVRVSVIDSYSALSSADTNITVLEAATVDTDALLSQSKEMLRNGDSNSAMVFAKGLSSALNVAGYAEYHDRNSSKWYYNATDGYYYLYNGTQAPSGETPVMAPGLSRRLQGMHAEGMVVRRRLLAAPPRVVLRRRLLTDAAGNELDEAQKIRQRRELMSVVQDTTAMLYPSTAMTEAMAAATTDVCGIVEELDEDTQNAAMGNMARLVTGSQDPNRETRMSDVSKQSVADGLSNLNEAAVANDTLVADEASANRTAEVMSIMQSLGSSLLLDAVDGEDPAEVTAATLAMSTQRSRSDLENSPLYTAPLSSPGTDGSSASFPASLGKVLAGIPAADCNATARNTTNCTAVALPKRSVSTRILVTATDAHYSLVGYSNDSDSDAAGHNTRDGEALDLDSEGDARNVSTAGGSTQIALMHQDGRELDVHGLEEAIEVVIGLAQHYQGTVAEIEAAGHTWLGVVQCSYWNETHEAYDTAGCIGLPNPAPSGAGLSWRTLHLDELPFDQHAWTVTNQTLLEGCYEEWGAVFPEWNGTDAGYRKYGKWTFDADGNSIWLDEGMCLLATRNDTDAGCWWEWTEQRFVGRGCEVSQQHSCLCTHLTDFKAEINLEVGELGPPKVQTTSMGAMARISAADLLKSALLLAVVFGFIGGGIYLAVTSTWMHREDRQKLLNELVRPYGSGLYSFRNVGGIWTWSMFEEDLIKGVQKTSERAARLNRAAMKTARDRYKNMIDRRLTTSSVCERGGALGFPYIGVEDKEDLTQGEPVAEGRRAWRGDSPQMDRGMGTEDLPSLREAHRQLQRRASDKSGASQASALSRGSEQPCLPPSMPPAAPSQNTPRHTWQNAEPVTEGLTPAGADQRPHTAPTSAGAPLVGTRTAGGTQANIPSWFFSQDKSRLYIEEEEDNPPGGYPSHGARTPSRLPSTAVGGSEYKDGGGRPVKHRILHLGPPPDAVQERYHIMHRLLLEQEQLSEHEGVGEVGALDTAEEPDVDCNWSSSDEEDGGNVCAADALPDSRSPGAHGSDHGFSVARNATQARHPALQESACAKEEDHVASQAGTHEALQAALPPPLLQPPDTGSGLCMIDEVGHDANVDRQRVSHSMTVVPNISTVPQLECRTHYSHRSSAQGAADVFTAKSTNTDTRCAGVQRGDMAHQLCAEGAPQDSLPVDPCAQRTEAHAERAGVLRGDMEHIPVVKQQRCMDVDQGADRKHFREDSDGAIMLLNETTEDIEPTLQRVRKREMEMRRQFHHLERSSAMAGQLGLLGHTLLNNFEAQRADEIRFIIRPQGRPLTVLDEVDQLLSAEAGAPSRRVPVRVRRRMVLKLKCFARFVEIVEHSQDMHSTERLCGLIDHSLTILHRSIPLNELRQCARRHTCTHGRATKPTKDWGQLRKSIMKTTKDNLLPFMKRQTERCESNKLERIDMLHAFKSTGALDRSKDLKLPMERMLGTALMLAWLEVRAIVPREQLQAQLEMSKLVQWNMPSSRPFLYYFDIFKVLITMNSAGWYLRSVMWNLVLLQSHNGSYDICQGVATLLHAGDTSHYLETDPNYELDVDVLVDSVPETLTACEPIPIDVKTKVWATICCIERYRLLPFEWVVNPRELPSERRTLEQIATMYLNRQKVEWPQVGAVMEQLCQDAKKQVTKWRDDHLEAITALRQKVDEDKELTRAGMSEIEQTRERREGLRRELWTLWQSHPFMQIAAVGPTAPFTRAQQLLVLVNGFLFMLMVELWLEWSRASLCCTAFKTYLGCTPATADSECWGYTTCFELYEVSREEASPFLLRSPPYSPVVPRGLKDAPEFSSGARGLEFAAGRSRVRKRMMCEAVQARDDEVLPQFLQAEEYTCVEFPRAGVIMDMVYKALITVGISLLVNLALSALFTIGGTPSVLKFLAPAKRGMVSKMLGSSRLENTFYFLFTVILDFTWLARILARYFLMLANFCDAIYVHLREAWKTVADQIRRARRTLWFMLQVFIYRRDTAVVLQGMEVNLKKEAEEAVERLVLAATVTVARAELDSLFVQTCYILMTLTWALVIWFQLVYAVQLRSLEGPASEHRVINGWLLAVILENCGLAVFKTMILNYSIYKAIIYFEASAKGELGVTGWYERFTTRHLSTKYSLHNVNSPLHGDGTAANAVLFAMPGF